MKDPEIQAILQDPMVRQVIRHPSGGNGAAGQTAMNDPVMRGKIGKPIASGVLQTKMQRRAAPFSEHLIRGRTPIAVDGDWGMRLPTRAMSGSLLCLTYTNILTHTQQVGGLDWGA